MTESNPFKVLIAYRPFSPTLPPEQREIIATDETIQWVDDCLKAGGIESRLLYVAEDVEAQLKEHDPRDTVIFNYCDGYDDEPTGYDPVTQVFEQMQFAYTGADDRTLWHAQDKATMKRQLIEGGIPTPQHAIFDSTDVDGWDIFPALVKPSRLHASLGLSPNSVVFDREELKRRVGYILETWKQPALVEDFIEGPEFRVSVWGNGTLEVLPILRVTIKPRFFPDPRYTLVDFDTKWDESRVVYEVPARVGPVVKQRIEEAAIGAYRAVKMRDYGSMDIRLRDDQPYVIDPNQNADISEPSYVIRVARVAGYTDVDVLTRLVHLAAERRPHLKNRKKKQAAAIPA